MSTTTPRPGKLLLGVDIGTGSSKGVLTDTEGTVLATSEQPHDLSLPRPGWAEHDAEDVWWADFTAICTELVAEAGDAEICGISVSGIGPCIVVTDEPGDPERRGRGLALRLNECQAGYNLGLGTRPRRVPTTRAAPATTPRLLT